MNHSQQKREVEILGELKSTEADITISTIRGTVIEGILDWADVYSIAVYREETGDVVVVPKKSIEYYSYRDADFS